MWRFVWGILVLLGTFCFITQPSISQEEKWTHYGLRPLAMGNAFVSVVDDFNALFYNPAGLARLKEWDGDFLNPSVEISDKTQSFIKDAIDLAEASDDTSKILDIIEEQTGDVHHLAVGWTPNLIFQNFGFGIGLEISGTMVFHRYPSVDLDIGPEVIIPIAYAHSFLENRLSVGVGVKFRGKAGVDHEFSIQDIEAFQDEDDDDAGDEDKLELEDFAEAGYGVGGDIGILFTPMTPMEPTLGISITDIGGTKFKKAGKIDDRELEAPKAILPSVNLGVSMKPLQMGKMYILTALDMHSINQPFSYSKKVNLGMEWGYGEIIKLQMGVHQGYLSGGLQFDVGLLYLRLATYAEELGAVAGTIQDRRYAAQLKILF